MDATLYETCTKHGLTGLGVNVFGAPAKPYIGVYVHWADGECASGIGKTFDEALSCALAEMAERRQSTPRPTTPIPVFFDGEDRSSEAA